MIHFFATDFYTGDRIRQIELDDPAEGILMIGARDTTEYFDRKRRILNLKYVTHIPKEMTEIHDQIYFYWFERCEKKSTDE